MSIDGFLTRDLVRMSEHPEHIGRPITNPEQLAALDFFYREGMTKEQAAERAALWAAEDAEADLLAPVSGEPPTFGGATVGLSGVRAMWARYLAWDASYERTIDELNDGKRRLEKMIESPQITEASLTQRLMMGAQSLIASIVGEKPEVDDGAAAYAQEKARQAAEEHAAKTARLALPEIQRRIDIAKKQLDHLRSRRDEFLVLLLRECAEPLANDCAKKLVALRESASKLFAFESLAGGFGSGWERLERVTVPRPGSDVCKLMPAEKFVLAVNADDRQAVRDLVKRLLADPRAAFKAA
jgi:hypothetical protein